MKQLKLFPKIFLYTFALLLFLAIVIHGFIYSLAPKMELTISVKPDFVISMNESKIVAKAIEKTLPISLFCSLLLSGICSLLFSKAIADPIKKISATTGQMMVLNHNARCPIYTGDEIGSLAQNINKLYSNLLSTIEHLEQEKEVMREMERGKVDFLRAASHELKTPITALNATLENMILGIGKYRDYSVYLPECKEMVEQLSKMIHEILEASRQNICAETSESVDLSECLKKLCEPYQLIAAAHRISFSLNLPKSFPAALPIDPFQKAVSNILANAVSYTEAGKTVSVRIEEQSIIIENECIPIPDENIRRLFEPFYRPDFSRSRDSGGNGLGLYLVDAFLTSINISYSFTAMENLQGMRFTIFIK